MHRKPTLKEYKYRIYPTASQIVFFTKTFGCCRLFWNKILDEKLRAYEKKECIPRPTPAKYKNVSKNFYFVELGRHGGTQALADVRSPYGLPKKPSCVEVGSSTAKR